MSIYAADLFCGAGGTSTGMVNALKGMGYQVEDIDLLAVNHWDMAIATHSANHPWARHLCENLDNVNPRDIIPGGYLDLMVASPECTHHSRARGGKPISDQSRASAWHVLRWAEALFIENILIENVPEFMTWGPLDREGDVIQNLKGKTFLAFIDALRSLGYNVGYQVINCADYGDPTTRKRLFIMAKRSKPAIFPEPTHAKSGSKDMFGERLAWKSARDVIDWSIVSESIFTRKKPLSPNTMRRIMKGLQKFSSLAVAPFVVTCNHGNDDNRSYPVGEPMPTITSIDAWGVVQPFILQMDMGGSSHSLTEPMNTITSADARALVEPYLVEYHGSDVGRERVRPLSDPLPTQDTSNRFGLCEPFIVTYYGTGQPASIADPLDTITAKDRFGLVLPMSDGRQVLVDIKFRMLQPHELAAAMSFPPEYQFTGTREQKVKQIGNAVPGRTAEALVKALFS
jgi:DNA (cytosine-5)-methyltransferase 1